jgi:hypothetical protein
MTIGETLRLKTRKNVRLGFLAWLAFAGSIFVSGQWGVRLLPLVLFLPFIGIGVGLL